MDAVHALQQKPPRCCCAKINMAPRFIDSVRVGQGWGRLFCGETSKLSTAPSTSVRNPILVLFARTSTLLLFPLL